MCLALCLVYSRSPVNVDRREEMRDRGRCQKVGILRLLSSLLPTGNEAQVAVNTLGTHVQEEGSSATYPRLHCQDTKLGDRATWQCCVAGHQDITRDAQKKHVPLLLKSLRFGGTVQSRDG